MDTSPGEIIQACKYLTSFSRGKGLLLKERVCCLWEQIRGQILSFMSDPNVERF